MTISSTYDLSALPMLFAAPIFGLDMSVFVSQPVPLSSSVGYVSPVLCESI